MLTSSRRGLSYPNPATRADTADVPRDINTVIAALELDVVFGQGAHASRPAAGAGAPTGTGGGRLWWETDTLGLFYDNGTAWIGPINAAAIANGSITLAMLAANSVDASKIVDGSVGAAEIADGSVGSAEIAATLKPSGGAGGATEALRAIGTAAGQVASGVAHAFTGAVSSAVSLAANGRFVMRHTDVADTLFQSGKVALSGGVASVTFPIAYSAAPVCVATPTLTGTGQTYFVITAISATAVSFQSVGSGGAGLPGTVHWMAFGPAV
jgi:hypothetical protein